MNTKEETLYVVGIGASAGGLEALELFFKNMPRKEHLAFVVVQHLSPDYKSLMVEILSKHTDMEVHQAEDGMKIKGGSVYVIVPKKNLIVFNETLYLRDKDPEATLNLPIDIFFKSLAEDKGERAVSIVLSGTGSDGTRGIRSIKEANGLIMVQDPDTAKFDGMPNSALATGVWDYVLEVEEMPDKLLNFVEYPKRLEKKKEKLEDHSYNGSIQRMVMTLREETGVDFSNYKKNTIERRIERRMGVNQIADIKDYVGFLEKHPQETQKLFQELLIGVTRFFRDTEAFELLEERIIPSLLKEKQPGEDLRLWVAGCSTGEEAYSLAILLREAMDRWGKDLNVKIFASDIDKGALDFAGLGKYSESIVADVSKDRLEKYFMAKDGSYQVRPEIREIVVFARQNFLKDPPFNRIDLLSCRNVLIYLDPKVQKKVLSFFHFALNHKGYLFLGASESLGDMIHSYDTLSGKWKIYRVREGDKKNILNNIRAEGIQRPDTPSVTKKEGTYFREIQNKTFTDEIAREVMKDYVPSTVAINDENNLVYVFGDVNRYLALPKDSLSFNILKMVHKSLSIPLHTAIKRAKAKEEAVTYKRIPLGEETMELVVKPYFSKNSRESFWIISFIDQREREDFPKVADEGPGEEYDEKANSNQRISDLEYELNHKEETLQATIEELETSNEELQATNEELLASNEELQSTNEELQSVNEELYTVNSEYQNKIEELTELNDDMNNLLNSTEIGTIFIDKNMRIRKFTPGVKKQLNLLDGDVGRPLSHISHNLDVKDLLTDGARVLDSLRKIEREVQGKDDRWYLMKIIPYRTSDDRIKGIVISFVDITRVRAQKHRIQELSQENQDLKGR